MKAGLRVAFSLVFAAACLVSNLAYAVDVWVCPDLYRIDPAKAAPLEKAAADVAAFKKSNEVWDAEKKAIRLFGARNEVLAFQVVFEGSGKELDVEVSDLKGPETLAASKHAKRFLAWNAFGDALIPFSAKKIHPFSIPGSDSRLPAPPGQKAQSVWVDISLRGVTKAGTYTGKVNVTAGGKEVAALALEITVWDITLPAVPTVYGVLNCYGPKYLRAFHDGYSGWSATPDQVRVSRALWKMVQEHRGVVHLMPYKSQKGYPRRGCAPKVSLNGGTVKSIDWTAWDKRFGPYLDGTAFDDGVPVPIFYLPVSPLWPVSFKLFKSNPDAYKKTYEAVVRAYAKHIDEKGWRKTSFAVFGSMKENVPWHLDEPTRLSDYKGIGIFADITAKVAREFPKIQLRYQVDCGHYYCEEHKGGNRKDIEKVGGEKYLKNVNMWFVSLHSWKDKRCLDRVRLGIKEGRLYWSYGGVAQAHGKSFDHAARYLQSWMGGGRGYMHWSCTSVSPLGAPGKNSLVYNGNAVGLDRMLPSARLKHMRRGAFDCEYYELAAKAKDQSRERVVRLAPKYIAKDPVNFYMGRNAMAALVLGKETGAGKLPLKPSSLLQAGDMFCPSCGELVIGGKAKHKSCPHCKKAL